MRKDHGQSAPAVARMDPEPAFVSDAPADQRNGRGEENLEFLRRRGVPESHRSHELGHVVGDKEARRAHGDSLGAGAYIKPEAILRREQAMVGIEGWIDDLGANSGPHDRHPPAKIRIDRERVPPLVEPSEAEVDEALDPMSRRAWGAMLQVSHVPLLGGDVPPGEGCLVHHQYAL